jgi:hypothetical protein
MKRSQRGQMRDIKERAIEATKIKIKKEKKKKKERGGNTTILLLKIHTCASK